MRTVSQFLLTFLLNACWQIALIAGITSVCAWMLRGTAARYRHMLWVAALIFAIGLPLLTGAELISRTSFSAPPAQRTAIVSSPGDALVSPQLQSPNAVGPSESSSSIQIDRTLAVVLVALYLLFLLYRAINLFRAWQRTRAIGRDAHPINSPGHIQTIIGRCQTAIGVVGVNILSSGAVTVPMTAGVRKPLVILPDKLVQEGDTDVLTSAVGHELVHVLRRDYLLNLIYELIYLPLSFHPAAALVRRRINQTRELGCDELVTQKLLAPEVYARSLVQLAGSAMPLGRRAQTITVGIADADILEVRIMSLLRKTTSKVRRNKLLLFAAIILLVIPCIAAASLALKFTIDPRDSVGTSQEQSQQQEKEKKEKAAYKRSREGPEREEVKERMARDPNFRAEMQERERKQEFEWEMKSVRDAELVRLARITMEQAIQIATSQQPGKVLQCSLVGDHWEEPGKLAKDGQVLYHVVILPEEASPSATHVLVNAIDGTILKTEKELPRKMRNPEQR